MIVKNEERNLANAVESARGLVDEVVVVDTGSSDGTRRLASQLGAKLSSFRWRDDFSAARNVALERVSKSWVLILDADEYLEAKDFAEIRAAVRQSRFDAYFMPWKLAGQAKIVFGRFKMNLFRNRAGIRFSGLVHEEVFPSVAPERWSLLGAIVHHQTVTDSHPGKREFYLRLNQKQSALTPDDERYNLFLGMHYQDAGLMSHARYHWVRALNYRVRPYFAFRAAVALARDDLERNFAEARLYFAEAERLAAELMSSRFKTFYPEVPAFMKRFGALFARLEQSNRELGRFKHDFF